MDLEVSLSQDEHGSEWVKEMSDMNWIDQEVQTTAPDLGWQLPSYLEGLRKKYDEPQLRRSNL